MNLRIYNINDIKRYKKVLRTVCEQVSQINEQIKNIVYTMIKTNIVYNGIGIASPQIGSSKRIIVIDQFPNDENTNDVSFPLVLINPTFKSISNEKQESIQGCLSVPRKHYKINRFKNIFVTGLDLDRNKIEFQAYDLLSFAIQHEIDHLNGKLICDIGKLIQKE